jgi:hypothetical protein
LPKNDEGEFELVLGNRQLISVFVIVVALLGVFFSMGYIVGRNSSPVAVAGASEAAKANTPSSDARAAEPAPGDGPPPGSANDSSAATQAPPSATQPEKPPAPARVARPEQPQASAGKPKPFSPRDPAPATEGAITAQPAGGQYWQVVATTRPDAEIIAEALSRKGFHTVLAPAPKDGVFRVLIGPLADAPAQAQTRTNLEAAGFKNPILRKY